MKPTDHVPKGNSQQRSTPDPHIHHQQAGAEQGGASLRVRWPESWSFSFNISTSNEHPGLISTGWISLQSKGLSSFVQGTLSLGIL